MIKKFKKAVISSILAAIVIFGAVVPMASAAVGPSYTGSFYLTSDDNEGYIYVNNIDSDTTKVELYNNSGVLERSAVNTNTPALPSPQVTSGQELTKVKFSSLKPGRYTVAEFSGSTKSALQSVELGLKNTTATISWAISTKGTVTVTNLTPGSTVNLVDPWDNSIIYGTTKTTDSQGSAVVFSNIDLGTSFTVKEVYSAINGFTVTNINGCYTISTNSLPALNVDTDAQGTVTVSNAVYNAEVKLYLLPTNVTTGNDTVTSKTYLTAIAPISGKVVFSHAATEVGQYTVYEIGSGLNEDRAYSFRILPDAPTLTLTSDGMGVVVTGAEPNARVRIYKKNDGGYYDSENADETGTATFDHIDSGIYTAKQTLDSCQYSEPSNEIAIQKWMTRYLAPGWNTLSVPFALKTATLEAMLGNQIGALEKAYAYDPTTTEGWVALTTGVNGNQSQYLSKPMTALYVNISGTDEVVANFVAIADIYAPPILNIKTGWNLVGPSLLSIGDFANRFLAGNSTDVIPMLVNPNSSAFVYTGSNNGNYNVYNTYGYWVYAKTNVSLIGQISTGTVSDSGYDDSDWEYNNNNFPF